MNFIRKISKNSVLKTTASIVATFLILIMPMISFAAASDFKGLVQIVIDMIKTVIPLVVSLTLLIFIWGIFQLVKGGGDDDRKKAIAVITYGIIALFVMVSVWGLVNILTSTFFSGGLAIPQLNT